MTVGASGTIGPFEPVPPQEPVAAAQEGQDDDGIDIGRTQIGGAFEVNLPTLRINAPNSYQDPEKQRLRLERASVELPEAGITFDADVLWLDVGAMLSGGGRDLLIDAVSPVVRGGTAERPWSLECASIESKVVGDEVMITLVAPLITAGDDSARADYLALWVDRAAWSRAGSDVQDPASAPPRPGGGRREAELLAELLFELQTVSLVSTRARSSWRAASRSRGPTGEPRPVTASTSTSRKRPRGWRTPSWSTRCRAAGRRCLCGSARSASRRTRRAPSRRTARP